MGVALPCIEFWKDRDVFVTGHTGFKGSWLIMLLKHLGANVFGYALEPDTDPNLFSMCALDNHVQSTIGDIRDFEKLKNALISSNASIVIHLAAQPLVRKSYIQPQYTFETNLMGTVNILEAVKSAESVKSVVVVTTDKCYENTNSQQPYCETDRLGGYDPYSASKACAELITTTYRNSFFDIKSYDKHGVAIATARAGNVIGGGDWAEDRLIPDIVRSISKNQNILIRYPDAIRPWQHVLAPLSGYLLLAEKLFSDGMVYSGAWNFGPEEEDEKPVLWLVENLLEKINASISKVIIDREVNPHETGYLKLNSTKANENLNWNSKWNLEQALESIAEFVNYDGKDEEMFKMVKNQIVKYLS